MGNDTLQPETRKRKRKRKSTTTRKRKNTTSPELPKDFESINNAETEAKRYKVNKSELSTPPLKRKISEEDEGETDESMSYGSESVGGKSLKNHKASKKTKTKKKK